MIYVAFKRYRYLIRRHLWVNNYAIRKTIYIGFIEKGEAIEVGSPIKAMKFNLKEAKQIITTQRERHKKYRMGNDGDKMIFCKYKPTEYYAMMNIRPFNEEVSYLKLMGEYKSNMGETPNIQEAKKFTREYMKENPLNSSWKWVPIPK